MIRAKNGEVMISGSGEDILAEYTAITAAILDMTPEHLYEPIKALLRDSVKIAEEYNKDKEHYKDAEDDGILSELFRMNLKHKEEE